MFMSIIHDLICKININLANYKVFFEIYKGKLQTLIEIQDK